MAEAASELTSRGSPAAVRMPLAGSRYPVRESARPSSTWRESVDAGSARERNAASADAESTLQRDALALDGRLLDAAAQDARCRYAQARLMREFLTRKAWAPLAFSSPRDYAAEVIGVKLSTIEKDVRVLCSFAQLPKVEEAFLQHRIRWTHARLLATVATPASQDAWLALARSTTTRLLQQLITHARKPSTDVAVTEIAANGNATAVDDEPLLRWTIPCTGEGRQLWRATCELAARVSGAPLPAWQAAEAAAAEVLAGAACRDIPPQRPAPTDSSATSAEERIREFEARHGHSEGAPDLAPPAKESLLSPQILALLDAAAEADAFQLDERLRAVRSMRQSADSRLGALLHTFADADFHKTLGFATLELYMESRLGISASKGFALLRLARRAAARSPLLMSAYREGRISALAATTLLPVMGTAHDDAWITRAGSATYRHLLDAVSWALDRRDDHGAAHAQPPPPFGINLRNDALARLDPDRLQMRAGDGAGPVDRSRATGARILLRAPAGVIALLEQAIESCRRRGEMPWRAFERMLARACLAWLALPEHRDPVFAREGYRCAVPGCSKRAELEDHHLRFRSAGGGNDLWNRLALCAWHHHCGVHLRRMRVFGHAPDNVVFELGCREGKAPLLRLIGDRYLKR